MRSFIPAVALFVSAALAQTTANAISGTPSVVAGQETTIEWTNPSDGTVDIWLQPVGNSGENIQADDGVQVASGIDAADLTATFTVAPDEAAAGVEYTLRIVNSANAAEYNFSPGFEVQGATGEADSSASGSASASASGTDTASLTATDSASITETDSATETETDSSTETETDSQTSSATETDSSTTTATSGTSSSTSTPTSAPDSSSGVGSLKVQGGMVALVAAAIAML